jgi:hypothetical protein
MEFTVPLVYRALGVLEELNKNPDLDKGSF